MEFKDFQKTVNADIRTGVTQLATLQKPHEDFLFINVNEWMTNDKRKLMLTAQNYYQNENDIKDRKRYYIDRKGVRQEVTNLTNSKLVHPFLRKLTNQKVNYLLSKELVIQSDDDNFNVDITKYLDKRFLKMLKNIGKDAIVNGIAWVQVYYDEKGELKFKRIPSEQIIPFWADADHTILEGIIRAYSIVRYLPDGVQKEIKKVEYHTVQGVWYYEMGDKGLKPDPDKSITLNGHFTIKEPAKDKEGKIKIDEEGNQLYNELVSNWEKVPFIAFKYNSDEISLLKWIKPLIDDYDLNTSDTSNNLQDIPNSIKVVKNYDGTDKGEFTQNLATFRTAFVSGDGDMTSLETNMDIAAIDSHLNRLRKDIYEAGNGVDTQEISVGNASGVALKFRYADLDTDTDDLAAEFSSSLDEVLWFIKIDMINKGMKDYLNIDVEIIFNTDMIINESESIIDAEKSLGIISEETIIANHPWVTDVQAELDRIQKEEEEKMNEITEALKQQNIDYGIEKEEETPKRISKEEMMEKVKNDEQSSD